MKRYRTTAAMLLIVTTVVFFGVNKYESVASIHSQAASCIFKDDLTCDGLCSYCHPAPKPDTEFYIELHQKGDVQVCSPCHEEEAVLNNANLLSLKAGGNHPSQIVYDPATDPELKQPSSVVLYCGKGDLENSKSWSCKLLCSTCHDVHIDVPRLLRISNYGSALCYDCHVK